MSSIDGISSPSTGVTAALQIAQQNQRSAVSSSESSSSTTNLLTKLNAMYGSDGSNKATSQLDGVAGLLGVDSETLTKQLQGPNADKVNQLMSEASLLKSLNSGSGSSGSLFDSSL